MKVLHVIPGVSIKRGGPSSVISGLTEELSLRGIEVEVFAVSEKGDMSHISNVTDVRLFPEGFLAKVWTGYSDRLAKTLMTEASNFDLIHIHEIWHYPHFAAYKAAKHHDKPFVVTIHGTLDSWCLDHKALRKKLYSALFQKNILKRADGIHAMTENEVEVIARFVDHKRIFCISNGIDPDEFDHLPDRSFLETRYPELKDKKVILFMGRIHPKKGLDLLAKVFSAAAQARDDIHLMIAGPDEGGYAAEIVELLKSGKVLNRVTFTGMLEGHARLEALSRADIFVLPSYSEGFSMSILEAMTCKLPVIITKECNFDEVEEAGAGLLIESCEDSLWKALISLLDNSKICLEMGTRGRNLVLEKFTWDKIADQMLRIYKDILESRKSLLQ